MLSDIKGYEYFIMVDVYINILWYTCIFVLNFYSKVENKNVTWEKKYIKLQFWLLSFTKCIIYTRLTCEADYVKIMTLFETQVYWLDWKVGKNCDHLIYGLISFGKSFRKRVSWELYTEIYPGCPYELERGIYLERET